MHRSETTITYFVFTMNNTNQQVPSQLAFVPTQHAVTPETPLQHPLHDWQHMTRTVAHYKRLEQIGLGTYGQVYRAICLDTGRPVALKKMRPMTGRTFWGMPLQLIREIKILKQLQHPNLLQMIEVVTSKGVEHLDPDDPITTEDPSKKKDRDNFEEDQAALAREKYKGNLFLVLEYLTHDLTGLMDVAYQFTPVQIKCIFQQLLQALRFMHENKYVHRDIKSSNILLDSHFRLKLADFGLARSLEPPLLDQMEHNSSGSMQDLTNKVITLWYRPPEILLGTVHYGCAVDVWSAGCILAELMTGKPLAAGKTELDQLALLADLTGTPDDDTWNYLMSLKKSRSLHDAIPVVAAEWREGERKLSKLRDRYGPNSSRKQNRQIPETAMNLLEKLLEWDPRKRLTAANALKNRYFWTQPVAPVDPTELGRIDVAVEGHFHEFQTKQKRRQAKQQAEEARDKAVSKGASADEAADIYDTTYIGIMKQVAKEGLSKPISQPTNDRASEMVEKESRKSRDDVDEGVDEKKNRKDETRSNRSIRSDDKNRDRRDREHSRREGEKEEDDGRERKRYIGEFSDDEGDRRRMHKKKRDRAPDQDDERSISGERPERHAKEKRRLSGEDRSERRLEKEKRSRKGLGGPSEADDRVGDRRYSPNDDYSEHSDKERRSKRSRHGSVGGSKKDRRSRKGTRGDSKSGDKDKERRHHRSKRHRRPELDHVAENIERYRRPEDAAVKSDGGKNDRGSLRGEDQVGHYGPAGGRMEPRVEPRRAFDGTWDRGPGYGEPRPDERRGFRDDHDRDRPPPLDHYGPPRRDRDGQPPDYRRDRDGPPPRDEFGPGPRRERDGPPPRGDDFGPGSRRDRGVPPSRKDEFVSGPRRDWDGPPLPRVDDFGPGPRRDRDGPPPPRGDDFRPPPRRDRDGPPLPRGDLGPGPRRDRDGPPPLDSYGRRDGRPPPRDDFGLGPPRDRDGPPLARGGDVGSGPWRDRNGPPPGDHNSSRRDGPMAPRGDFGPGPYRDDGRDGPNRRPISESRRPRDRR